jgi:hypothetical protein
MLASRRKHATEWSIARLRRDESLRRWLLDNCLHDGIVEIPPSLHIERLRLRHENAHDFLFGVDPEIRAIAPLRFGPATNLEAMFGIS